jgi:hypothetical protein
VLLVLFVVTPLTHTLASVCVLKLSVVNHTLSTHASHESVVLCRTDRASVHEADNNIQPERQKLPSPYFEPLIRSLLIGVASGGVCESVWTLSRV